MKINHMIKKLSLLVGLLWLSIVCYSQLKTHHIFDNNMVLQREKAVRIWGWASIGEEVRVEFGDQARTAITNGNGEWEVYLDPMPASNNPREMIVKSENSSERFSNVLVGDVWILGGQSNMEFDLARIINGDLEIASSDIPGVRLMTIPRISSLEPLKNFDRLNEYDGWYDRYDEKGYWFVSSPGRVKTFSALGYIFGSRVNRASGVPIGLIDVSRGGTTLEAWISPGMLSSMPENDSLIKQWKTRARDYDPETSTSPALDYNFPGSCYNGYIEALTGLSVKGIIFHHGYNNALSDARPILYMKNFKALIQDWRNAFADKSLPFGIIELSAGGDPQTLENFEVRMLDAAPYIREGQYAAYLGLDNIAYVSAYDQQVKWYHPQKKIVAGERMARWALTEFYQKNLPWQPARMKDYEIEGDTIILSFDIKLKSSDDRPFEGFALAGSDKRFFPAKAKYYISGTGQNGQPEYDRTRIVVSTPFVKKPIAVRYAWARNPLGNMISAENKIIPLPQFRTDNWKYPEAPYNDSQNTRHREKLKSLRSQAEIWAKDRMMKEAERFSTLKK